MKHLSLLLIFTLSTIVVVAQEETKPVHVEIFKKNGEKLRGHILQIRRDTADFQNQDGSTMRIAMNDIRNIDYIDGLKTITNNWFAHPNTLRYFLTSSAIPLEKKRFQLGSTYGYITTAHYGLTDRVSIGGGADLFGGTVTFANAKVNLLKGAHHAFSAGVHYYRLPADFLETYSGEDVRDLGMLSAASTWGNENNNVTVGAGYMYIMKGFLPPIVTVGGTVRVIERLSLVTENWFFFVGERTGTPVVISLGARYLSRRSAIDLGLYSDDKSLFDSVAPYVAYSIKLGRLSDQ